MSSFREAVGTSLEWLATGIGHHFSNFRFVDERFHSCPVLRRVLSLARKLNYESLVVEEITPTNCEVLHEGCEALAVRDPSYSHSKAYRLLLLNCPKDTPPTEGNLLGYAVFQEDYFVGEALPRFHVFESVVTPVRPSLPNNFVHCARNYQVNSGVGSLSVNGVLYAKQNDLTFVCAHVALRTALASVLPNGDVSYAEINRILGIDHRNRKIGGGVGLSPQEMEMVFQNFGIPYSKIMHEPGRPGLALPGDFQRDLYGIIESGMPALLGFELDGNRDRHIIPVIGHTFNEDTWVAESARAYFDGGMKYFPSENWLSTYIVHDDNFGPYYCLPRHYLKKDNFRITLGVLRSAVTVQAVDAEAVAIVYFKTLSSFVGNSGWLGRFRAFAEADLLVLRTILIKKEEYLAHVAAGRCWDGEASEPAMLAELHEILPPVFWMVEASAPELFSATRRKFGEILLFADQPVPKPLTISMLIAMRLPTRLIRVSESSFSGIESGTASHLPLFQFGSI